MFLGIFTEQLLVQVHIRFLLDKATEYEVDYCSPNDCKDSVNSPQHKPEPRRMAAGEPDSLLRSHRASHCFYNTAR